MRPTILRTLVGLSVALSLLDPLRAADARADAVNSWDDATVQKVLHAIEQDFHAGKPLDDAAKRRALLSGLLAQYAPGLEVVAEQASSPAPSRTLVAETLENRIGYIRPGGWDGVQLAGLDAAILTTRDSAIQAVILDLRAMPPSADFSAAARMASRFVAPGQKLFTLGEPAASDARAFQSEKADRFEGVLVVLVDADTQGAAEVLAAVLRQQRDALIVGAPTSGRAAEFGKLSLPDGKLLLYGKTPAVLADGKSLFPGSVQPDIAVALDPRDRQEIFQRTEKGGVSRFISDAERPRFSEASLVAQTNPEIQSPSENEPPPQRTLRDTVLQRALDVVTAIAFFQKAKSAP